MNQIYDDVSINVAPLDGGGRLGRETGGDMMIAIAHPVSTMIGPGVQALAWAMAQLGLFFGLPMMIVVAIVTYYTVTLQAAAYNYQNSRSSNHSYVPAVRADLGRVHAILYGMAQCLILVGTAIAYTIASSRSMEAILRSCNVSISYFMIGFGVLQIILSQINNIDKKKWFIVTAAIMSFVYPIIGVGLAIKNIKENRKFRGSPTGILGGEMAETQKIWRIFQAFGVIAFNFSYVLINSINNQINEIEEYSPPSRDEARKKATRISVIIASGLKIVYGCLGYAAFGDTSPENLLSDNTLWVADIANAAIFIHVVCAYQIFCQPLFASIGETAGKWFPNSPYITKEITLPIPGFNPIKLNLLSLLSRALFVVITTAISILVPFFNYVIGIIGAVKFFALTVYFPVQIHIAHNKIPKWSSKWFGLELLCAACFVVSADAVAGSVAGIVSRHR